jgi:hypothetical protein
MQCLMRNRTKVKEVKRSRIGNAARYASAVAYIQKKINHCLLLGTYHAS